ncbi:MAG: hypothetical protein BGO93_23245 [Mesorhizobium sp. 65-26]|nr:MAG: hypothetical protein BGO93_23245 [Mesorhizobium sp. 65-26]
MANLLLKVFAILTLLKAKRFPIAGCSRKDQQDLKAERIPRRRRSTRRDVLALNDTKLAAPARYAQAGAASLS